MILNIPLGATDAQRGWKTGTREAKRRPTAAAAHPELSCDLGVPGKESRQGASRCQIEQGSCLPEDRPPGTREMTASCTWPLELAIAAGISGRREKSLDDAVMHWTE